jgi:DUF4097 and DUF4098 domain-containing protein YvlB
MKRSVIPFVALALVAASHAEAQDRAVHDRLIVRDGVTVARYQGRDRGQREEQTERSTRTLKVGQNGEVYISNIAGNISVVRGGGNEAALEIVKTSRGRTVEDAKEMLGLVQVDIIERGGRVEIKTRYPQEDEYRRNNRRNLNVSVAFNLTAPAGTRVSAHSISGEIAAKDIKGDVQLESVSGGIRISNAGRLAAGKSISGNVEISDTEIEGQLEASSVSGNVILRNVKARSLEAGAVSGNLLVQDVACDRVEAQTVSGGVQFAGTLIRGGRYELSSHSGDVQVAIAGDTGFEVEATSFSGNVRSDIALNVQGSTGRRRQQSLRGVHGDGSAVLDLTTFSGSIVITKR